MGMIFESFDLYDNDEVNADKEHADLYGGERTYCDCGRKLIQIGDDGKFVCPKCNGDEVQADKMRSWGWRIIGNDVLDNYFVDEPHTDVIVLERGDERVGVTKDGQTIRLYNPDVPVDESLEDGKKSYDFKFYRSKRVVDMDGEYTDYSWFKSDDGRNIFVYGHPYTFNYEFDEPHHSEDSEEEAIKWFDGYEGETESNEWFDGDDNVEASVEDEAEHIDVKPADDVTTDDVVTDEVPVDEGCSCDCGDKCDVCDDDKSKDLKESLDPTSYTELYKTLGSVIYNSGAEKDDVRRVFNDVIDKIYNEKADEPTV